MLRERDNRDVDEPWCPQRYIGRTLHSGDLDPQSLMLLRYPHPTKNQMEPVLCIDRQLSIEIYSTEETTGFNRPTSLSNSHSHWHHPHLRGLLQTFNTTTRYHPLDHPPQVFRVLLQEYG